MRIVAGAWRGRRLLAPAGAATRPTADRVRQALFDMLLHAPWGGRECVEGAAVLDAFAGTGALGLEALSRGAAHATFMERDRAALAALRANIAACRAEERARVLAVDATRPPPGGAVRAGVPRSALWRGAGGARASRRWARAGWIAPDALIVAELGREEALPEIGEMLAERAHGAARLAVWRAAATTA